MSNYVYTPAFGALPVRAGLLPQAAPKSLKDLSPAQKRQAVKNNRSKIIAEFRAKGVTNISVNNDGTLHLKDFASDLDAAARALLNTSAPSFKLVNDRATAGPPAKPVDVINALPLSAEQKRALTQTPFSTAFNGVTAILILLNDPQTGVITNVLKKTGSTFDLSTFPFNIAGATRYDISLVQPGDELFDEVSQAKMLRLRTLTAFLVLFWRKWAELHAELAKQALDWLFAKEDVVLTSTVTRGANNPATALVVDRLPLEEIEKVRGVPRFAPAQRHSDGIYEIGERASDGARVVTYFRLSSKGLADRRAALQADYDRKYPAYVQDFKFWHPDFAARVGFVKSTEGKSESASVAKVAAEYDLPGRFAREHGVYRDARFRVTAGDALGGPMVEKNGPRADLKGLGSLGAVDSATAATVSGLGNYVQSSGLGAAPAVGFVAAMAAIQAFCVACPVIAGFIVVGVLVVAGLAVGVTYLIIMGAMGRDASFFLDVKEGKAGGGQAKDLPDPGPPSQPPPSREPPPLPPDESPPSGGGGGAGTQSEGASGGFPVVPVALAAGLALLLLSRR